MGGCQCAGLSACALAFSLSPEEEEDIRQGQTEHTGLQRGVCFGEPRAEKGQRKGDSKGPDGGFEDPSAGLRIPLACIF